MYRRDLDFLLRDYFVGFLFSIMEVDVDPGFLIFLPNHETNVSDITATETDDSFNISLVLDTPFPDTVPDNFTVQNSILAWSPQFTNYTIDGNVIFSVSALLTDAAPVNSYITVQDDSSGTFLGNYFVEERFIVLRLLKGHQRLLSGQNEIDR